MDNKVLVNLIVPEIDQKYDINIPINKKIGSVIKLLSQSINEMNTTEIEFKQLYNASTSELYDYNTLVANTNIRNGTRLILIR